MRCFCCSNQDDVFARGYDPKNNPVKQGKKMRNSNKSNRDHIKKAGVSFTQVTQKEGRGHSIENYEDDCIQVN